jgi:hypothetical protein
MCPYISNRAFAARFTTDPYPRNSAFAVRNPVRSGKPSAIPEKHRRFFRPTFRKIACALKILPKDAVAPEKGRDAVDKIYANLIFGRLAVAL